MKIEWNQVTRTSQAVAIVLFFVVYALGFYVGRKYENKTVLGSPVGTVEYMCKEGKVIDAVFYKNFVHLKTPTLNAYIPQTVAASGVRYANEDESLVFWGKDAGAFMAEGTPDNITYKDCTVTSQSGSSYSTSTSQTKM